MHARDVMTHPVLTVTDTAGVGEAAQILISHGFTALPVVDADGRLIGIVTESDFIAVAINLLELMEEQEPPGDF